MIAGVRFQTRPLSAPFPRPAGDVRLPAGRFRAPLNNTLAMLAVEVHRLGATVCVIEVAVSEGQIRADGLPRARAVPTHPGVRVSFTSVDHGPLTYACDGYSEWQANLRAVTLTLEALRAVARYGVATSGEQYRGWQQLPPGTAPAPGPAMTHDEAVEALSAAGSGNDVPGIPHGRHPDQVREWAKKARNQAARRYHPDNGDTPDEDMWRVVTEAYAVLTS